MTKVLQCKHIGSDTDCTFEARGETQDDIPQQVAVHAKEVHGINEVTDELVQAALANIKDED